MNVNHYKPLAHKEVIKCIPKGKYKGNLRCHINCLEYYRKHPEKVETIVGCVQVFSDNDTSCHFIVKLKDGTYIDPTYGIMVDMYNYVIPIEEYDPRNFKPYRELQLLRGYLITLLPWHIRLFTNKNHL